jgi:hypothetical protein
MGRGSGSPLCRHRGVAAEVEAPLWKTNPRAGRFRLPTPAFRACPHRGFPRCGIAVGIHRCAVYSFLSPSDWICCCCRMAVCSGEAPDTDKRPVAPSYYWSANRCQTCAICNEASLCSPRGNYRLRLGTLPPAADTARLVFRGSAFTPDCARGGLA